MTKYIYIIINDTMIVLCTMYTLYSQHTVYTVHQTFCTVITHFLIQS